MERAAPAGARVSDDAPRASADLVLLRAASSGALGPAGPARLLARVAGAAARLCGARLASIALLTEGRDHLELRSVFGTGGVIAEQRLPVRQSLNGTVITSARSFRSPDVWRDRRPVVREIARRNRTRGVLIVPLATREVMLGTLNGRPPAPRAEKHDIPALLMADRTCREVAAALELSDHTVPHHVDRLKLRFGKATLHGLLRRLVERHLLD